VKKSLVGLWQKLVLLDTANENILKHDLHITTWQWTAFFAAMLQSMNCAIRHIAIRPKLPSVERIYDVSGSTFSFSIQGMHAIKFNHIKSRLLSKFIWFIDNKRVPVFRSILFNYRVSVNRFRTWTLLVFIQSVKTSGSFSLSLFLWLDRITPSLLTAVLKICWVSGNLI